MGQLVLWRRLEYFRRVSGRYIEGKLVNVEISIDRTFEIRNHLTEISRDLEVYTNMRRPLLFLHFSDPTKLLWFRDRKAASK